MPEKITTQLHDGSTVEGVLWPLPSGGFAVDHRGIRKIDQQGYSDPQTLKNAARDILRAMAENRAKGRRSNPHLDPPIALPRIP